MSVPEDEATAFLNLQAVGTYSQKSLAMLVDLIDDGLIFVPATQLNFIHTNQNAGSLPLGPAPLKTRTQLAAVNGDEKLDYLYTISRI